MTSTTPGAQRSKLLSEYGALLLEYMEKSINTSESRVQWRVNAAGLIQYWLGKFFDDAAGDVAGLEALVETQRNQLRELRNINSRQALRIRELESRT